MSSPNCNQDCYNCPFVVDPNDSYRHVCIKCGREYSFRQFDAGLVFVLAAIAIVMAILLSHRAQPPEQPADIPLNSPPWNSVALNPLPGAKQC